MSIVCKYKGMKRLRSKNSDEKEERRNQILAAAIIEFDEAGYENTTMTSISKRSGISRTLINFYFKDKKSLHMALEERALSLLEEKLMAAVDSVDDVIAKLKMAVRCFIIFYEEHRGFYECILRSDDEVDLEVQLKDKSLAVSAPIVKILKEGCLKKTIKNPYDSYEIAAISIWCVAHGYASIVSNKHKILNTHWGINSALLKKEAELTIERVFRNKA